jgi:hypothetical protein
MLEYYSLSYAQATVDNCGQTPVDKRPRPAQPAMGEGVGPAGKGHRNGSPANIFYFYFLKKSFTIRNNANHDL